MPLDIEDELARLYGADLAEFVVERTRLAGALKKEGRRAEAQRVRELRKPSLSVWVVNRLAHSHRKELDLLLDAAHRLSVAQRTLLTGGDRQAFDQASKAERESLHRLAKAARSILGERASAATLERVTSTLRAAAVSDDVRPDLARGRLTVDVDLAGFEAFAGVPTSAPSAPKPRYHRGADEHVEREQAEREAAARRATIERAKAALRSAREREAKLAKKLRESERSERAARATHQRAERAVERLRTDHDAAATEVEAARARLDEAQRS